MTKMNEERAAIEAAYASVVDAGWSSVKDMGIQMFQAGAAWQRAQGAVPEQIEGLCASMNIIIDTLQRPGMTLRDYFAAKAMQGLCAHPEMGYNPYVKIADAAYHQADAMLAAIAASTGQEVGK